jgi:hypothetical protein
MFLSSILDHTPTPFVLEVDLSEMGEIFVTKIFASLGGPGFDFKNVS